MINAILDLPEARALVKRWTVEVHRKPRGGTYAVRFVREAPAVLECESVPAVEVDLGELFQPA